MTWKIKITIIGFCAICLVMQIHEYLHYSEEGLTSPIPNFQSNQTAQPLEQRRFAYYTMTGSCVQDYLFDKAALGDATLVDFYVLSYKEECKKPKPGNVRYIFKRSTTWTSGRNLLYSASRNSGKQYLYHIFMDDDVIPIFTEHMYDFEKTFKDEVVKKGLLKAYLESSKGYSEGKRERRNNTSAWRAFENDLLKYSPAFSVSNYISWSRNYIDFVKQAWSATCYKGKKMPWVVSTTFFDELFIAFHDKAAQILLPYSEMFDDINWTASAWLNIFRSKALLFKHGMANLGITVVNAEHRPYPRQALPNDFLHKYLEKDGKDLVNLIDEDDLDNFIKESKYYYFDKTAKAFLYDRALCTGPIRYPLDDYFRRS